ncbi:MAG: HAD family phosphatase [Candidatus Saccharimonadales bacterium]
MNYLFDLDGLLINSEELYLKANRVYFSQFSFEFSEELHKQGTGKKFSEWIKSVTDIEVDGDTILVERNKVYFEIAKTDLHLLPGAKNVLEYAKSHGKTAMVTSSNQDYVDFVLEHTGIADYFELFITGDQVSKGKPNPEGYLTAAKELGVQPESCIVFEDAPNGVEAGKNAGMKVVAVPSPYVEGDPTFDTVDLLLESLDDYIKNANIVEHKNSWKL